MDEKETVQVKVCVGKKELFRFLLYHNYGKPLGILQVAFSIGCLIWAAVSWGEVRLFSSLLLILMGCMFTILEPVNLYWKAMQQAKQPFFSRSMCYTFSAEEITLTQGEETASAKWDELWKIVRRPSAIYLFFTPVRANIIPLDELGTVADGIMKLARQTMDASQVKG